MKPGRNLIREGGLFVGCFLSSCGSYEVVNTSGDNVVRPEDLRHAPTCISRNQPPSEARSTVTHPIC